MTKQEQFEAVFNNNIHREGADKLLDWLIRSDFFKAPASSRFHLNVPEGLCKHSLNVYCRLFNEVQMEHLQDKYSEESIAICGLLHDICKANFYKETTRNVKNEETGKWEKVPYYAIEDQMPLGHGEKSVIILQSFMKLSMEEVMAVNWHMGGFDDRARVMGNAYDKYPLALLLHVADLKASHIDDVREGEQDG